MMMLPGSRPRISQSDVEYAIAQNKVDRRKYPLLIVGIRGYYRDTMGKTGVNDRGIYDDAMFIVTPEACAAFNGNTDPSRYRL